MFFADSQLMHGPMMPIFESVQAIPSTDVVQTFECDPLSGSQVRVHTNIKKRQKQMQPKLIPSVKLRFSGGNKTLRLWRNYTIVCAHLVLKVENTI